jgi:hypothetical protein
VAKWASSSRKEGRHRAQGHATPRDRGDGEQSSQPHAHNYVQTMTRIGPSLVKAHTVHIFTGVRASAADLLTEL